MSSFFYRSIQYRQYYISIIFFKLQKDILKFVNKLYILYYTQNVNVASILNVYSISISVLGPRELLLQPVEFTVFMILRNSSPDNIARP